MNGNVYFSASDNDKEEKPEEGQEGRERKEEGKKDGRGIEATSKEGREELLSWHSRNKSH